MKNYLFKTDSGFKAVKACPSYESACAYSSELRGFYQIPTSENIYVIEPEEISDKLYDERIIPVVDKNNKPIETKNTLKTTKIITVVYADYKTVFFFDVKQLKDQQILGLIEKLIDKIQEGTNYTREIIDVIGDTYFVY